MLSSQSSDLFDPAPIRCWSYTLQKNTTSTVRPISWWIRIHQNCMLTFGYCYPVVLVTIQFGFCGYHLLLLKFSICIQCAVVHMFSWKQMMWISTWFMLCHITWSYVIMAIFYLSVHYWGKNVRGNCLKPPRVLVLALSLYICYCHYSLLPLLRHTHIQTYIYIYNFVFCKQHKQTHTHRHTHTRTETYFQIGQFLVGP